MTVPALFSCSLALERDEKRSGAGVALGPAPPSAVLLRARPSCSGPRTHSRTTAGRTGAVPREPTGPGPGHRTRSFAAAFAGGAVLVRIIRSVADQARLPPRTGCSRRQGHCWKMPSRTERPGSPDFAAQWGTELAHRTQRMLHEWKKSTVKQIVVFQPQSSSLLVTKAQS